MNLNLKWVMEAIRSLTNVTVDRGATEAEAMAAADKVEQLLKQYNVSLDRVFLGENKCVKAEVETEGLRKRPIQYCVCAIADFCDCKCWFQHGINKGLEYRPASYAFFGMETDIAMAQYLYRLIDQAIDNETIAFQQTPTYVYAIIRRKTLTTSFQKGMVNRIYKRLSDMAKTRKVGEAKPVAGTGTSLVVVKNQKVELEFAELGMKLRTAQSTGSRIHKGSYEAGQVAGNRIGLNRPLTRGSVALLQ